MEDAALKVMEAARAAEGMLAERAAALAAVTAEYERKQAEARPLTVHYNSYMKMRHSTATDENCPWN